MFGSDELWIFIGYAAAQTVAAIGGLMRDRSWVSFGRPDMPILKHALDYGLPLIVSAVFIWVTQNTPRLLVRWFYSLGAAGIYSLGFGLGFRVAMVAAMSVTAAAFPLAVSYANRGDDTGAMRQLSHNAALLVGVLASSMVGLALVSGDLVDLAIAAPLRAAVHPIMVWSLLAGSIICFRQHFLHQVFLLKDRTRPIGTVSAIEAVVAVAVGLLCVPRYGAVGGIVALTITSTMSMTTMFVLAMRLGLRPAVAGFRGHRAGDAGDERRGAADAAGHHRSEARGADRCRRLCIRGGHRADLRARPVGNDAGQAQAVDLLSMGRLLILTSELPPFRGGIATYAHELATAAAATGHEVTVAAPDYHADQSALDATLLYRVVRFRGGPATMRGMPGRIALVRRLLRTGQFDIVHAADWPFFVPVRLARRATPSRVLLTLHGTEILYMNAPRRRRVLDLLRFWNAGWATWIANSAFTAGLALDSLPIDPSAIRAVPLGVSTEWIAARPNRGAARERFVVGRRFVIISLGRVVPRKGHAVLADALAMLPPALAERIDWWIVGPLLESGHAELPARQNGRPGSPHRAARRPAGG